MGLLGKNLLVHGCNSVATRSGQDKLFLVSLAVKLFRALTDLKNQLLEEKWLGRSVRTQMHFCASFRIW